MAKPTMPLVVVGVLVGGFALLGETPGQSATDPDLAAGRKIFQQYCVTCHGTQGKGDGPAGKALKPPPANFVSGKRKYGASLDATKKVIKNGIGPMPPWGGTLNDKQISQVAKYANSLQKK